MSVCPECSGSGKVIVSVGSGRVCRPCSACESNADRIFSGCGVPTRHIDSSFDGFVDGASAALERALSACMSFPDPKNWLVLSGPPGVGKTHLMAAMLRHAATLGVRGRYVSLERLYSLGRDSFGGINVSEFQGARRGAMKSRLLCLDELGAGRATDFEVGLVQEIINHRYGQDLPTVFATNYRVSGTSGSLDATKRIGAHSMSRIIGCSTIVEIDSADWRKKSV